MQHNKPFTMPQVQNAANVIVEDLQNLITMVKDTIVLEAVGYASPDMLTDKKMHQKGLLHLLNRIQTAAAELSVAALISTSQSKVTLKSKVAHK